MKVKIIKPEYIRTFGSVFVELSVDRALYFERLGVCHILEDKNTEETKDNKRWITPENKNEVMKEYFENSNKEIKGIFPQIDEMEEGKSK